MNIYTCDKMNIYTCDKMNVYTCDEMNFYTCDKMNVNIHDEINAALPLRSPLGDQGLFRRPFGQNWSLFSLLLEPKSPFQFQNTTIIG